MLANAAFVFHGEQLIPIFIAALLITIAILSGLGYLLARVSRRVLGRRSLLLAPLPLLAFGAATAWWMLSEAPNAGPPTILPSSKVHSILRNLPDYAPFSFSGAAYFGDHLYLGSNIGLLQIDDAAITRLFQMQKSDSVVSGPWLDRANRLLWVLDDHTNELLNFNGSTWRRVPMPTPSKGYYSRGDILEGIKPAGDARGFWIAAGGSAWRWSAEDGTWVDQRGPELSNVSDSLIGVMPIEGELAYIIRHEPLSFLIKADEEYKSDTVVLAGEPRGRELTNQTRKAFLAESWTTGPSAGYVCDRAGEILRVTTGAIGPMQTPGICEAMTVDPEGNLVASFRDQGIFRLVGQQWERVAAALPSNGEGNYWAYLAVSKEQTAYVMSAKPVVDYKGTTSTSMHFTRNADTAAWVIRGAQMSKVPVN